MVGTIAEWLAVFGQPLLEHARSLLVLSSHALSQAQIKMGCVRSERKNGNRSEERQAYNDNRQKSQEAA